MTLGAAIFRCRDHRGNRSTSLAIPWERTWGSIQSVSTFLRRLVCAVHPTNPCASLTLLTWSPGTQTVHSNSYNNNNTKRKEIYCDRTTIAQHQHHIIIDYSTAAEMLWGFYSRARKGSRRCVLVRARYPIRALLDSGVG